MSDENVIKGPDFEGMSEEKLREYAKHMRIAVKAKASKEEILEAIYNRQNSRAAPTLADKSKELKPGYARILIHEDPTPGAKQIPVYLNSNGYECTIPRGVEVEVPMRVVRVLNDAKVKRRQQRTVQDNFGRETFAETTVTVPSYPFTIVEQKDGPEVLTSAELAKLKSFGPRRRYAMQFGHYPTPAELTRAIEQGLVKIGTDEQSDATNR